MGAGRAEFSRRAVQRQDDGHGVSGSRNAPPDWRSNGHPFVHGPVPVEREVSASGEWSTGNTVDGASRLDAGSCATAGGMQRGRAGSPCQDGAEKAYYARTHLAKRATAGRFGSKNRVRDAVGPYCEPNVDAQTSISFSLTLKEYNRILFLHTVPLRPIVFHIAVLQLMGSMTMSI